MKIIPTRVTADKPTGHPFVIERCAFHYGEQIDAAVLGFDEDKVVSWPMVYILANDDAAYVGQTTSVATRINQHSANEEKRDFETVSIIFNEEFNASVVTDYEHRIIGYMHGDGRYRLTNKNEGMADTNYFSKARYSEMFDDLWEELRKLELADHTLAEIEESEVFKFSPFKGLTADQRVALDCIIDAIKGGIEGGRPIVIEGMPGTGKTILAIYLLKMLKDDPVYADKNIRIMEPVTSLRNTLKKSLRSVSKIKAEDIIAPTDLAKEKLGYKPGQKKCFDIVLVDEAHKLKQRVNLGMGFRSYDNINRKLGLPEDASQLDWVVDQVKTPIFFYDRLQSVGPSCVPHYKIESVLGDACRKPIRLDSQMRVKGGKEYLEYIAAILNGENPMLREFDEYEFELHENFVGFIDDFKRKQHEHSLSRMIAGYAWKWITKDKPRDCELYDIQYDGIGLRWNITYDNWVGKGFEDPLIANEVGCIHSIQGYDLSYAYVIIGEDLEWNEEDEVLRANKNNYYDKNGKNTASPEELTRYIKNIYYVLMTRGVYGTHVYVASKKLREYLARFFR